jgi:hypothetical protein
VNRRGQVVAGQEEPIATSGSGVAGRVPRRTGGRIGSIGFAVDKDLVPW